jgi:two-component system phosphate regulon response regulator PhoB
MCSAVAHSVPSAPPLIVVIEDEEFVLAGYQTLLESWGYDVVAATSADEALSLLTATAKVPDFVVADYRLGDGNTGTDAVLLLRRSFGPGIPGVLITGDTTMERVRHATESGLQVLHKPINGRQLRDIVQRGLGN